MRVLVARNKLSYNFQPVKTYSGSVVRALRERGHEVIDAPKSQNQNYDGIDLVLDIDCGRDLEGRLIWAAQDGRLPVPSAVMFIDSHGYPDLHRKLARNYDHVFFAVHDRRDLFADHKSAHWCPNFTDAEWFDGKDYPLSGSDDPKFGFFGSKGGLSRAKPMLDIATKNGWTAVARQVSAGGKHRWPATSVEMSRCQNLFNHGQKHDGPNLRVMESMLMKRPLVSDKDERSGMDLLFKPWAHYIPYEAYSYGGLENAMRYAVESPELASEIARNAYQEVKHKHLVGHRMDQILEVVS